MVKVCAFAVAVLFTVQASAVEVTFDGSGNADFDTLATSGNYIDVGRFRWSDFSATDLANVAPAPAVSTDDWYLYRRFYEEAALVTGMDTRDVGGTGGEQSFTWSTTISKIGSGRQIGGIWVANDVASGNSGWQMSTTLSGGLGSQVYNINSPSASEFATRMFFAPQDSVTVTMDVSSDNSELDGFRVYAFPAPSLTGITEIPAGENVWDAVFGGISAEGGIDVKLHNVITPGTLTVTPTIVPTSELSQSVLDSLPYVPGDTFQSYDFDYSGDLGLDILGFYMASIYLKYDPEELGILPQSIRVFHQTDEGEWYTIKPQVFEDLNLITWQTDSFSSFSLGEAFIPEPSSGLMLLLGMPLLKRLRKYGRKAGNS